VSAKDIYEADIFAANVYAAGVFRGIGVDFIPSDALLVCFHDESLSLSGMVSQSLSLSSMVDESIVICEGL